MPEPHQQEQTTPESESSTFVGEDGRVRSGWRVAGFFCAFALLQIAAQIAFLVPLTVGLLVGGGGRGRQIAGHVVEGPDVHLAAAIVTLPLLMLLVWFFRRYLDKRTFRSLGFWFDPVALWDLFVGLAMGAGLILVAAGIVLWSGLYTWGVPTAVPMPVLVTGEAIFMAIGLLAAALIEEIVCRAYMQRNLTESIGPVGSIAIVSTVFALLHGMNPGVTGLALINLFVAGVLLGLVYHRFRSIWAVWTMHFSWNFTMGTVLGVPVSGMKTARLFEMTLVDQRLLPNPDWWAISGGPFGFEGGLASTLVMVVSIALLWLWKGRPSGPVEVHPQYLWKLEQRRVGRARAAVARQVVSGPEGSLRNPGQ